MNRLARSGAVIDGLWAKTGYTRKIGGLTIDGVIGLGGLPQLAGALSRTKGTLTLAPVASAQAVLNEIKGREVAVSRSLGGAVTQGRVTIGYNVPTTFLVPVTIGGKDGVAALALSGSLKSGPMAELSRPLVDSAAALTTLGNLRVVQSSLGLGGETMSLTAMETLDLRGYAQEPYDVVLRDPRDMRGKAHRRRQAALEFGGVDDPGQLRDAGRPGLQG